MGGERPESAMASCADGCPWLPDSHDLGNSSISITLGAGPRYAGQPGRPFISAGYQGVFRRLAGAEAGEAGGEFGEFAAGEEPGDGEVGEDGGGEVGGQEEGGVEADGAV